MRNKLTAQISLYYKFHKTCDLHMLSFLYEIYCSSFYGMEIWYDTMSINMSHKSITVAYHKTIKRICGLNKLDGNHLACGRLNVSIFEHLLAKRIATFYHRTISSTSISLKELKFYHFSRYLLAISLRKFFYWKIYHKHWCVWYEHNMSENRFCPTNETLYL